MSILSQKWTWASVLGCDVENVNNVRNVLSISSTIKWILEFKWLLENSVFSSQITFLTSNLEVFFFVFVFSRTLIFYRILRIWSESLPRFNLGDPVNAAYSISHSLGFKNKEINTLLHFQDRRLLCHIRVEYSHFYEI